MNYMFVSHQAKFADSFIRFLAANNGFAEAGKVRSFIAGVDVETSTAIYVARCLIDDFKLIVQIGEGESEWLRLTSNGFIVAEIGISEYINQQRKDTEMQRTLVQTSIANSKKSIVIAVVAIIVSILAPLISYLFNF